MKSTYTHLVVFSVQRKELDEAANKRAHTIAVSTLHRRKVAPVQAIGMYEGVKEDSIILVGHNLEEHERNKEIAAHYSAFYNQECYLEIHHDGAGVLHYTPRMNKEDVYIGQVRFIEKDQTKGLAAYTLIPHTNKAIICG